MRDQPLNVKSKESVHCEICILAGGLSRRMGRDKARLRWGRRTMLAHIRATATGTGFPVRIIRRDLVPRCGPVGGVDTALSTTKAEAVLFLACDMPLVSADLLWFLLKKLRPAASALFVCTRDGPGFPFLVRRKALSEVTRQLKAGKFSLHELAGAVKATLVRPPPKFDSQLTNINTPRDWKKWRRSSITP
jgi:molybdopterin-guanine dinucleotide biosynthesis protein A